MASQNHEAERLLLGCVLLDNTVLKELTIRAEHFSDPRNAAMYEAMHRLDKRSERIDSVSLYTELNALLDVKELSEIENAVPSVESFKHYEKHVMNAWKERVAEGYAKEFLESTDKERVSQLLNELSELEEVTTEEANFDLKESLSDIFEEAQNSTDEMAGIPTGFHELDQMSNGNQEGQLIIVAGRPSMGKTAYALNIALGHLKHGAYAHIYSLEMGKKALLKRMITAEGNIDSMKMRSPKQRFDEVDWNKFNHSIGNIENMNMHIDDRSAITIPEIYRTTKKIMRRYPEQPHFVVIDYLQLLRSTKRYDNRVQEVTELSRELKIMARDLNIPVIALSQLSRGVEMRQDKRPILSDLRESGSIEQDADRVELLYRDGYYNQEDDNNIIEIIIAKQREGPVGTVELGYLREYNKFVNLERRYGNDRS